MTAAVTVEIQGTDLPGRSCGPDLHGKPCENVHVGLKHRSGPVELFPGDAASVRWRFEMVVRRDEDGALDYGGPADDG